MRLKNQVPEDLIITLTSSEIFLMPVFKETMNNMVYFPDNPGSALRTYLMLLPELCNIHVFSHILFHFFCIHHTITTLMAHLL